MIRDGCQSKIGAAALDMSNNLPQNASCELYDVGVNTPSAQTLPQCGNGEGFVCYREQFLQVCAGAVVSRLAR